MADKKDTPFNFPNPESASTVKQLEKKSPSTLKQPQLTSEEMLKLEEEARLEVEKEMKKELAENFKEQAKIRFKKKALFKSGEDAQGEDDEIETITVDLAKYSPWIVLDGVRYYHGQTYKFTKEQAAVVREQIYRSWLHDAEIHGLDSNAHNARRAYNVRIGPKQNAA